MDLIDLRERVLEQINKQPLNKEVTVAAFVTMKVYNEYGEVVQEVTKQAESFTRHWLDLLQLQLNEGSIGSGQIYNVSGNSNAYSTSASQFDFTAPESSDSYGIQVGMSGIAATISDRAMSAKIKSGQLSGQLYYGTMTVTDVVMDAPSCYNQLNRSFLNQSTSDVPVNEVCLVANNGSTSLRTVVLRDNIPTVTVSSGLTGSVTYTIRVTV